MDIVKNEIKSFGIRLSMMDGGKEVGRASLYIIKNDLHDQPYGLVEDVFVNEDARGQGIGTRLVKQIIATAKEHNCYKLVANSKLEKERTHEWYKRLGFDEYGKEFRITFK